METKIDEIAPDVFRLSTHVPEVAPPAGFTFNQFVVRGEQPFLFHTGMRGLFPLVSDAVDRLVGVQNLRWISFAHVEADESGSMNLFLGAAPDAQVAHGALACMVSLNDLADRPPVPMADEPLDI
ncbi:MAG TPA: MBL fold metallo-hydrolase, partial [Acidimicrobiia bacterium]|nr:MBL fold metallo-hydrolase [Acidimicrobiia bacterium]